MSAGPGWYPDPAGQPGRYRYWDGASWSAVTSPSPAAPPPGRPRPPAPLGPSRRKSPIGWILGAIALLVAVVVLIALVVRGLGPGGMLGHDSTSDPTGASVCPEAVQESGSPGPPQSGDRVRSGQLSYPRLPDPFRAPQWDSRVPFGRDVQSQDATVEEGSAGNPSWVAGVLIARLLAGDGFYGPQQGADVVTRCITGTFYGDSEVKRDDRRNQATTIDGHDAWIVESHLSFDLTKDGIKTKGELMIVVVIDVGEGEGGLFYASIPDTSPQFVKPARDALAGLRVG